MNTLAEKPFSVNRLADRWECDRRYVVNLLKEGRLQGFRLGRRHDTWRIPVEAVAEFECQTQQDLLTTGENGQSDTTESAIRSASITAKAMKLRQNG